MLLHFTCYCWNRHASCSISDSLTDFWGAPSRREKARVERDSHGNWHDLSLCTSQRPFPLVWEGNQWPCLPHEGSLSQLTHRELSLFHSAVGKVPGDTELVLWKATDVNHVGVGIRMAGMVCCFSCYLAIAAPSSHSVVYLFVTPFSFKANGLAKIWAISICLDGVKSGWALCCS